MSLYSRVESGTQNFKSRFHKSISFSKRYDCRFGDLVPVLAKFCLPGDVWRIGGNALVRFHPMVSPTLTPNYLKVRYFFVPLRLVESNTELIITGSNDGKISTSTLPVFENFVANADKNTDPDAYKVQKYTFWDYMGVQPGNYENIKNNNCLPARYWHKAYSRIYWDYYDDENIGWYHQTKTDFNDMITGQEKFGANVGLQPVSLKKDYFTSSLPWQLKGTAPAITINGTSTIVPNYGTRDNSDDVQYTWDDVFGYQSNNSTIPNPFRMASLDNGSTGELFTQFAGGTTTETQRNGYLDNQEAKFTKMFKNVNFTSNMGFTMDDLRTISAQTRIFERLARCGSRYTEYLRSNFGISPADETLQRSQYLGGWSLPIVTTEVLQTAEDGSTPVGTMRGHGITRGGNSIQTFHCKEFGLLFGLAHILPQTEYTTGIPKELTYKERFDFFNPSFQHLSEQEVKNGELFISESDGKNDDTFGFQAYGNELRTSINQTVADLRSSLSYWNQALHFNSRPNLNSSFILSNAHYASFNSPFAVNGSNARPCIVDFYNDLDVYRPMVRYSTPGLVDHL